MQKQSSALTPQQEGIREVRERYEKGDLSFDQFEYALDALLQAQTSDECEAIVRGLPASSMTAFEPLPTPEALPRFSTPRRTRWWVACMSGVRRMKHPWRMAEHTIGIAVMGGICLDLSLAELPQYGVIRLFALWGGACIYVPRSLDVSVRAFTMMGGVNALGEHNGGMISFSHEESRVEGNAGMPSHHLEIEIFGLMGGAEVIQVDAPVMAGGAPTASPYRGLSPFRFAGPE